WRKGGSVKKLEDLEKQFRGSDREGAIVDLRVLDYRIGRCSMGRSIVVCQGASQVSHIHNCIVFANADLKGNGPDNPPITDRCIIFCDGSIEGYQVLDSILIATGSIGVKSRPSDSVVLEKSREPLKLLKLYDTRQAGVEVDESREGVVARK